MSLTELWKKSPNQLEDKKVQQLISFAGAGKLLDGSDASREFREYLNLVAEENLAQYAKECLAERFDGSGFALQDVVNQIGARLGFRVREGRYRGIQNEIGFDGLWLSGGGHSIVVEVKTTDAYRIDLNSLSDYRKSLIKLGEIESHNSSILIIVGRQDTGDLEAQVRGSRHAWDIRLISLEALLKLMSLKGEVEAPNIAKKICDILIPREFTKVDEIIDLAFSAAVEIHEDEEPESEISQKKAKRFVPVSFHSACVEKIEKNLNQHLLKRSRSIFVTVDGKIALVCAVSRLHDRAGSQYYWFAFHPHQSQLLASVDLGYVAFGCGSEEHVLLIPFSDFSSWLPALNITEKEDRMYWHVLVQRQGSEFILHPKKGHRNIALQKYLI